jgi:hypothetical protein
MDRVIQQHIIDVIAIHRLVNESCTRTIIIIASKRYWLIIKSFIKSMICYSKIEFWCVFCQNWCHIFDINPELIQIEIPHHNEMNHQIFNIDMNIYMRYIARNIIKGISFHRFHGPWNSRLFIWWVPYSLVDLCGLLRGWPPMCLPMPVGLVIFGPSLDGEAFPTVPGPIGFPRK